MKVTVKRAMIDRARQTMLVADASKFARTALLRVAAIDEIAVLVTDAEPPRALVTRAAEGDCEIVVAE
jgi:DeoR family glycerol-3-phosphate regulon repressor